MMKSFSLFVVNLAIACMAFVGYGMLFDFVFSFFRYEPSLRSYFDHLNAWGLIFIFPAVAFALAASLFAIFSRFLAAELIAAPLILITAAKVGSDFTYGSSYAGFAGLWVALAAIAPVVAICSCKRFSDFRRDWREKDFSGMKGFFQSIVNLLSLIAGYVGVYFSVAQISPFPIPSWPDGLASAGYCFLAASLLMMALAVGLLSRFSFRDFLVSSLAHQLFLAALLLLLGALSPDWIMNVYPNAGLPVLVALVCVLACRKASSFIKKLNFQLHLVRGNER